MTDYTPINVRSAYGSDVWSVQPSIALAIDEAIRISALEPDNSYEVVIETGDWNNPVYRAGELTSRVES